MIGNKIPTNPSSVSLCGIALSAATRNTSVDLLKILAMLGVIIIHLCSLYTREIGSVGWLSSLFWAVLVRASVPVFFMSSGAVFLDVGKKVSIPSLYKKYILRIVVAMLFWALLYKLYHTIQGEGALTAASLWISVKEVLLFKHEVHFYYLHILLLVYVFLPITKAFVKIADDKLMRYALVLWFALGILYPTVINIRPFSLLTGIPTQWVINMSFAAIGYFLLGHYLTKNSRKTKKYIGAALFICGFAFVYFLTWYFSAKNEVLYEFFLEGMSLGVFLMAAGLFSFIASLRLKLPQRATDAIAYVSKASFCVYLAHIFFIDLFNKIGITVDLLPRIISIPLLALIISVCGIVLYFIISKIPILNKWIV